MEVTRAPWAKAPAPVSPAVAANPTTPLSSSASSTPSLLPNPPLSTTTTTTSSSSSPTRSNSFRIPTKQLTSPMLLTAWKQSEAYADIVSFILHLNAAVRSVPSSAPHSRSPSVTALCELMAQAKGWVADIPPIQQAMRFGNKAFRTWHARLMEALPAFLTSLLGPELVAAGAVAELSAYLDDSFGNQQRIDYGTGHELNFVLFMLCLRRLGVVVGEDAVALVCDVFASYLDLMELIQHTYWLEPAGSKGSWGLDDYQFLCFLWGSSQLVGKEDEYPPSIVLKPQSLSSVTSDYLYFQAIVFIGRMKTGPFAEHSALLHSIAQLQSWNKANGGLQRMYEEEVTPAHTAHSLTLASRALAQPPLSLISHLPAVLLSAFLSDCPQVLSKFPIVQHIKFGSVLRMDKYVDGQSTLAVGEVAGPGQGQGGRKAGIVKAVPKFEASKTSADSGTSTSANSTAAIP